MEESTGPRPQADNRKVAIRVVGLGGAGINAINRMADAKLQGVEFVSIDTDGSELERSKADKKIALSVAGQEVSGPKPNPGSAAKAAQEHEGEIEQALQGSDMVFITCGEGGGTGTGASPLVAHIAKEMG
ncbi:MAG: cell division protein FtsZ, partial [Aeriscardovia sp.]|nr:cell division protein FtsZ [Aeriscardovia sp.]